MKRQFIIEAANGCLLSTVHANANVVMMSISDPHVGITLTPDEAWALSDALDRAAMSACRLEIDAKSAQSDQEDEA